MTDLRRAAAVTTRRRVGSRTRHHEVLLTILIAACLSMAGGRALADEVDDLLAALSAGSVGARSAALARLAFLGTDRPVPIIARRLGEQDQDARAGACRDLGDLGRTAATPHLLRMLADPEAAVRREAVVALGAIRDRRAVETLARVLGDREAMVRRAAIVALGSIGGPAAERAVAARSAAEGDEEALALSCEALGRTGGAVALRTLRALLSSPRERVARAAALALAPYGEPAAAIVLGRLLRFGSTAERAKAASALTNPSYRQAVSALAEALADEEASVRAAAASSLVVLGDSRGLRFLVAGAYAGPEELRIACTEALDRMRVPDDRRRVLFDSLLDYPAQP